MARRSCNFLFRAWRSNNRVRRSFWIPICFVLGTFALFLYFNSEITSDTLYYVILPNSIVMDLAENYIDSAIKLSKGKNVVNTENCKIPDLDPWTSEIRKLSRHVSHKCRNNLNLTFVHNQNIFINEDALESLGYSMDTISCCYRTIERIEQSLDYYGAGADNKYEYSETCHPMTRITEPIAGFIFVNCTAINSKGVNFSVYENFHLVAKLSEMEEVKLLQKFSNWEQNCSEETETPTSPCNIRPPSVLLLGIDSVSRLNFRRYMIKTIEVLKEIGGIDMKGYTKVGENTYPNIQAIMSSYLSEELEKICLRQGWWSPQDKCPYLWKNFSRQNYFTAHLEDSPRISIFNYKKIGFVGAPTDIYIRPWMLAAYTENSDDKKIPFSIDCLGYQRPEEHVINYIVDLANLMESKQTPYFITTWLTDLTHEHMYDLQLMDDLLADALLKLYNNNLLVNTLVFLISDHGYRWGDIRQTTSGWFEAKLPVLYIIPPESLIRQNPSWHLALEYNSNQLTTPFDIHETLKDILRLPVASSVNSGSNRGLSLFHELPDRSCEDAGIPQDFCACYPESSTTYNLKLIQQAAKKIISSVNDILPQKCNRLVIRKITSAVVTKEYRNDTYNATDFSISFKAIPNFRFEAIATYDNNLGIFTHVSKVRRTNKKNEDSSCLSESEAQEFELFCRCKKKWFEVF